ncbi:MAG: thymidine phosphorylase [Bacilli bacterium]|nr:thymidine phosphorylase [Bacilli bacterium]
MNIVEIINKKREKQQLTKEEIFYVINDYVAGKIEDYQMSSLLMAICLNGMNEDEVLFLTDAMYHSGESLDLSKISGIKVDKHSTGGVGDKTTLILGPLVASTGVKIAKMSGRGLGHTGGTIDKLESIPGFQTAMSLESFEQQVNDIHFALVGQMGNLVPADKKIYALRDVTGTVDSIPLIASSIMSKKLASGADKIVIDVKVGEGALVRTLEEARTLANLMVHIGKNANKEVICVLSNMDEPLGTHIGNSLEVEEAIEFLKGIYEKDVYELVMTLGTLMVQMGLQISEKEAKNLLIKNLENGKGYQKFEEFISRQGGNLERLEKAQKVFSVKSVKSGYINQIHTLKLGEIVRAIGAGRYQKEDSIDYGVGIVLSKKVGDFVLENEELLKIYVHEKDMEIGRILECFEIDVHYKEPTPLIYEIIK